MTTASTTAEWITAAATVLAATAAFAALAGAWITIRDNRRIDRRRLTHEYVARLENLEMIEYQALTSSFVRGGIRPPNISRVRWAMLKPVARQDAARAHWRSLSASSSTEDRRLVMRLLAYPNVLEGLASAYNEGLLDRSIVKAQVEVEATSFWERARWWIYQLRDEVDSNTFTDIEVMIEDLANQDEPGWYA